MKSNTFISVKNVFDQSLVVFRAMELVILRVSFIFYLFEVFINVTCFLFVSQTCKLWRLLYNDGCNDIDLGTGEFVRFARRLWRLPEM